MLERLLRTVQNEYLQAIEQELRAVVDATSFTLQDDHLFANLLNMFRYHLGWTDVQGIATTSDVGKRFRPLLVLLSCQAAGGGAPKNAERGWRAALPAAAAIELVHNFSLIHDDIEDNSPSRRGRPALWSVWGMPQAVNAGDGLFVLARLALDRTRHHVSPTTYAAVHQTFDEATLALTQGQFLDMCFETRANVSVEEYLTMVHGKTATLLAASTRIGAQIGTDEARVIKALARYGENLGIAFQIVDDILGIWGDPAVTGKSARTDIYAKKKTLPLLAAAQLDTRGELDAFFRRTQVTPAEAERIVGILEHLNIRNYAETQAEQYLNRALTALDETRLENAALARLRQLAHSAVRREK